MIESFLKRVFGPSIWLLPLIVAMAVPSFFLVVRGSVWASVHHEQKLEETYRRQDGRRVVELEARIESYWVKTRMLERQIELLEREGGAN